MNKRLCTTKINEDKAVRNSGGVSTIPTAGSSSTKYPRNTHKIKQDKQEKDYVIGVDKATDPSLSDLMPPTEALQELKQSTAEVKELVEEVKTTRRGRPAKKTTEEVVEGSPVSES